MVLKIPDAAGLVLDGKNMASLPQQAFAVTLSDSVIEHMIDCVQEGQDIQLSLGSNPSFIYDEEELKIVDSEEIFGYDIFFSKAANPTKVNRLPNPAMSIFRVPKPWARQPKAPKPKVKAPAKPNTPATSQEKTTGGGEIDDAVAKLQSSMAKAEANKLENSARLVDGTLLGKGSSKMKPGAKSKFLTSQVAANPRSLPSSPALSGIGSPSLGPTSAGTGAQEKLKQKRFPIIHELAIHEQTFESLITKYGDPTAESEFRTNLSKVADFDPGLQKWVMKKLYWKELDVFEYDYNSDEERQKAIDNIIKQYDRMRLGASDPLWQKLLPKSERGKGICLSKLQAAIAKGPTAPKINVQKPDGSSGSGADSEREDSSGSKKKGGEVMVRSGSGQGKKKVSAAEAQQKRLLSSNPKKAVASPAARASPKVSPTKPSPPKKSTAPSSKPNGNGGRGALSKEFVSDSDSDDEAVPLSTTVPKMKMAREREKMKAKQHALEKEKAREPEKPKDRLRETSAPKPRPAPKPAAREPVRESVRELDREKEKDTIRAQVVAKPLKTAKRPREEEDDDDSSSSGTPLSKRFKPKPGAIKPPPLNSTRHRGGSDISQHSRASSGASFTKNKNTSPLKSSPLASSPPTNASEIDHNREREREREREHDTIVSSGAGGHMKKRKMDDHHHHANGDSKKRPKLSPEIINKANKFKESYTRYEALHKKLMALDDPPESKMADLLDLHSRLAKMKSEIYREVPVEK